MTPSVIILSFNSSATLAATLERALVLSDDVLVVDSFSSDQTVTIAEQMGAKVIQHVFDSYGEQRNWAIETLPCRYSWQLHLDADEWIDEELIRSIRELRENAEHSGFLIPRYLRFLGRILKHGAMSPTWHLRLFRAGAARCEERRYDQHFYATRGTTGKLRGFLIDDIRMSLSEWTTRHNRWSDAEVIEITSHHSMERVEGKALGTPIEQKRYWRKKYDRLPLFIRPFALFIYRYIFRLGVLDGKEGLLFWVLQTFWFRFLIDAKLFEFRKNTLSES